MNIIQSITDGKDILTGTDAADTFLFSKKSIKFNEDHITNFSPLQGDKIYLSKSGFGIGDNWWEQRSTMKLVGRYKRTDFASTALFVYNKFNGSLYLNDRFGNIGCSRGCWGTLVATLNPGTSLSSTDIVLVD